MIYDMTAVSLHTCKVLWTGYITYSQVWISSESMCVCVCVCVCVSTLHACLKAPCAYTYIHYKIQNCVCTCMYCTHNDIQHVCVCVYSTECVHVKTCTRIVMYVVHTGLYLIHREMYPRSHRGWGSFFPSCWVWWLTVVSCGLDTCLGLTFNSRQEHWPCCSAVVWRVLGGAWLNSSSNTFPVYVRVRVSLC